MDKGTLYTERRKDSLGMCLENDSRASCWPQPNVLDLESDARPKRVKKVPHITRKLRAGHSHTATRPLRSDEGPRMPETKNKRC